MTGSVQTNSTPKRGAFIVIEGLDKSGKSTQASALHDTLNASGISVQLIKIPDRTTAIGKMIDSYLRSQSDLDDRAIHLLFSANRWELASSIEQLLKQGTTVLCDRYAFSGIAFSASKGLPYEWCRAPDISLPAPDLTIFLDVSPEVAKTRGGYGEERYENEDMQKRVREAFVRIGREMGSESDSERPKWATVDAGLSLDVVSDTVRALVLPLTSGVDRDIQKLWKQHL